MFPPRPIHLWVLTLCTSDSHLVCSLSSQVAKFLLALSDYVPNLFLFLLRNHHFHYHKYSVFIYMSTSQVEHNTRDFALTSQLRFSLSGNTLI